MPLMKSKSKKAFEHNVEAEMHAGKPQDQSLAIAYSVKRKAKRKKMAEGGMAYKNDSAKTESRPSTQERDNDSKMVSQNTGNKAPKNDQWTDRPDIAQSQKGPKTTKIKHPSMVPSSVFSTRLRDEEDDLQSSAKTNNGPQEQPPKHDDEEGPNRQGPKVRDMADEHSTSRKPYAKGGKVEASDYDHPLDGKYEDDLLDLPPSEDEGDSMAHSENEEGPDREGPDTESLHMKMMAEGGMADGELEEEHHASLTAAIMAKRDRMHAEIDSGAHDEDMAVKMALGGEIIEDDNDIHSHGSMDTHESSDQVDLSRNADEDANEEDQASFNALRKENYSESAGLKQMDSPEDSNEHGHDLPDEDSHDMVDSIRNKMNRRRQFKAD